MNSKIEISQSFSVDYSYSIYFTHSVFDKENTLLHRFLSSMTTPDVSGKILFVIEQSIANNYPELKKKITDYFSANNWNGDVFVEITEFPSGEKGKKVDILEDICSIFYKYRLCRSSFVGIIGGGAFHDIIGFAASLVHRGVRQVRFPTTTLSQCDSGVGVKTGVNLFENKNYLGTFAPPVAVFNDFDFLETLHYRDWIAAIPEAMKVAILRDANFYNYILSNDKGLSERNSDIIEAIIQQSATLHFEHIATSGDPFEFGNARPLDFGHWAAHKLEMLTNGAVRHGEAVGIGLLIDLFYAEKMGYIEKTVLDNVISFLKKIKLPIFDNALLKYDLNGNLLILKGIEEFREHLGGKLHITMPKGIGNKIEIHAIDSTIIKEAIEFLRRSQNENIG